LVTVPVEMKPFNSGAISLSQRCPISLSNGGARIKLQGDFGYRIFNLNGSPIDGGRGKAVLSVGANLTPGMYILSVEHKTGFFTGKIFKR
jgi:hypothetical protein